MLKRRAEYLLRLAWIYLAWLPAISIKIAYLNIISWYFFIFWLICRLEPYI
jgi:hypothetical protein